MVEVMHLLKHKNQHNKCVEVVIRGQHCSPFPARVFQSGQVLHLPSLLPFRFPLLRGTTSQSLNIKLSLALEFVIASSPSLSPRPLLASCNPHGTVQEVGLTEWKGNGIKGSSVRETKCEQGFLCVIF